MDDPGAELMTFDDVFYVSNGLVPICEFNGKRFGMPFRLMEPGSTIHAPGDRGRLIIVRAVAEWMGLLDPTPADRVALTLGRGPRPPEAVAQDHRPL